MPDHVEMNRDSLTKYLYRKFTYCLQQKIPNQMIFCTKVISNKSFELELHKQF